MKDKGIVVIVVIVLLLIGIGGCTYYKNYNKRVNNTRVEKKKKEKPVLKPFAIDTDQEFINSADEIYVYNVNKYNSIWWAGDYTPDTVVDGKNVKKEIIVGQDVGLEFAVMAYDGSLYYKEIEGEFKKIETLITAKNIGVVTSTDICSTGIGDTLVIEASDGSKYYLKYENGYTLEKFDEKTYFRKNVLFQTSNCLVEEPAITPLELVYLDNVRFAKRDIIKDNNSPIKVSYVIYVGTKDLAKYYVVSKNDKLYVMDTVQDVFTSVGNVESVTTEIAIDREITTINLENDGKLVFGK